MTSNEDTFVESKSNIKTKKKIFRNRKEDNYVDKKNR
jgi:hypothetical protein